MGNTASNSHIKVITSNASAILLEARQSVGAHGREPRLVRLWLGPSQGQMQSLWPIGWRWARPGPPLLSSPNWFDVFSADRRGDGLTHLHGISKEAQELHWEENFPCAQWLLLDPLGGEEGGRRAEAVVGQKGGERRWGGKAAVVAADVGYYWGGYMNVYVLGFCCRGASNERFFLTKFDWLLWEKIRNGYVPYFV